MGSLFEDLEAIVAEDLARKGGPVGWSVASPDNDTYQDYDYGDGLEESCQTCGGDGFEVCEDVNSSEGCWEPDCNGDIHTCPNCHGSGQAKDQWFW